MMISIVGISEDTATNSLIIAGILDILLVPFLFIKKTEKAALLYAIVWGILTALARIFANYSADFPLESIHQYLFEVVIRLPHGLVPLLAYFIIKGVSPRPSTYFATPTNTLVLLSKILDTYANTSQQFYL
jgi:hypothetical protein